MPVSLKHATLAVGPDAGNGEIRLAQWNEDHDLTMATGNLLGRTTAGAGAVEELSAADVRTFLNVEDGAEANVVDSVNGNTGVVVLDPDDLDDSATTNKFTTAGDISKLAGIEAGADVTDATNVEAAGALMDSEVTNLADVKAFDPADYATAAQGSLADSAVQTETDPVVGAVNGLVKANGAGTISAAVADTDYLTPGTAGSTYQPLATVLTNTTASFTTTLETKLNNIEANADVTDTTNVTAAGALMDSELSSEASVKAINQGLATTSSPMFAGLTTTGAVSITGDSTVTGKWTTTDSIKVDAGGSAFLELDANASGNQAMTLLYTNGNLRWFYGKDGGAESGSDAGSDFRINRYDDSGSTLGTALVLTRSNGYCDIQGVYNETTASAANVFVTSNGSLQRSTSSLRYKINVEDMTYGLKDVLNLRPVTYSPKPNGENEGELANRYGGLIAEEVDAAGLTEFVGYNEEGQPDSLHYGHMVALLVKAIQDIKAEVDELRSKLNG